MDHSPRVFGISALFQVRLTCLPCFVEDKSGQSRPNLDSCLPNARAHHTFWQELLT